MMAEIRPRTPEDVTGRVLRRAEVAKMSRKLQDRLALASYKAKRGLDHLSFSMVEARFESDRQMQTGNSVISSGSSSPSHSSDSLPYSRPYQSSPISAALFSDPLELEGSRTLPRKRTRFQAEYVANPSDDSRKVRKSRPGSQSSPLHSQRPSTTIPLASSPLEARFPPALSASTEGPNFSFVSDTTQLAESPRFEEENSFEFSLPAVFHGSPPRTPPPSRPRGLRQRSKTDGAAGEEGADLLLYLATSPSPAGAMKHASKGPIAPSTPPSNPAPLPSSMINTPGNANSLFYNFGTPGQNFNFADFCNVTPSPAQGAFSRTPGPTKTPLLGSDTRRRLNFDALLSVTGTTEVSRGGETGLGMELGGELRS